MRDKLQLKLLVQTSLVMVVVVVDVVVVVVVVVCVCVCVLSNVTVYDNIKLNSILNPLHSNRKGKFLLFRLIRQPLERTLVSSTSRLHLPSTTGNLVGFKFEFQFQFKFKFMSRLVGSLVHIYEYLCIRVCEFVCVFEVSACQMI